MSSTTPSERRRSRGFSLSGLSLSSRVSSIQPQTPSSPIAIPTTTPTPSRSRFKRVVKRFSSIRLFRRGQASATGDNWFGFDTDYMYDEDIDVSYEGLLSLAARIGDAKPRNLPAEFKASLPRAPYSATSPHGFEPHCAICLEKCREREQMMGVDECGHWFHERCFETWLNMASNCPVCRKELTPEGYEYHLDHQLPNSPMALSPQSDAFEWSAPGSAI